MSRSRTIASTGWLRAHLEHLEAVGRLADDGDVVVAQPEAQQQPDVGLVVGDQHPQGGAGALGAQPAAGRSMVTSSPPPGRGSRWRSPSCWRARARATGKPEAEPGRRGDGALASVEQLEGEVHVVGLQLGALARHRDAHPVAVDVGVEARTAASRSGWRCRAPARASCRPPAAASTRSPRGRR